jgi:preprotein translocase subunit SecG
MRGTCAFRRTLSPTAAFSLRLREKELTVVIGFSIVLIIASVLLVLLVLLHKGKGGGLSDLFGGGMSSSLGGSSVVEKNLDRITIFIGVVWFACIVALGLLLK